MSFGIVTILTSDLRISGHFRSVNFTNYFLQMNGLFETEKANMYCAKTCNSCLKPSDLRRQQMRQTTTKRVTTTRRTTTPKPTKLPQWFNRHMKKKEKEKLKTSKKVTTTKRPVTIKPVSQPPKITKPVPTCSDNPEYAQYCQGLS